MECYGSITGQVAEVTVDAKGKVKVDRMIAVIDCYHAANPNTIHQQMEGGAIFGLGQTMEGHVTVKDGAVQQTNFHNYKVPRMAQTPVIETYLPHPGRRPQVGRYRRAGGGADAPCNLQCGVCRNRKESPPTAPVDRGPDEALR